MNTRHLRRKFDTIKRWWRFEHDERIMIDTIRSCAFDWMMGLQNGDIDAQFVARHWLNVFDGDELTACTQWCEYLVRMKKVG